MKKIENRVNIGSLLTWSAWRHSDQVAIIAEEKQLTYRQFNEQANRMAHALRGLGVGEGDRVGILLMNCQEFLVSYFASAKIRSWAVTLNCRLSGGELAYIINDSAPRVLILGEDFLPIIDSIRRQINSVAHYVIVGSKMKPPYLHFEDLLTKSSPEEPSIPAAFEDVQLIMYTSGTTGFPKGAMITHRHLIWNSLSACIYWGLAPEDITLTVAPMFHIAGLHNTTVAHLHVGAGVVLLKAFDPLQVLKMVARHRVTNFFMVPTMWKNLLGTPELSQLDLASLRFIFSGAAAMPASIIQGLLEKVCKRYYQGYGLTEAGPNACYLGYKDALRKVGSIGKPFPHLELKILNDKGEPVAQGDVGEIALRGNQVFSGYYRKPEETRKVFLEDWFLTGDLARMDEEGFIYITDRKKDMIISGGENIYSAEVERVLNLHPSVLETAVVGVRDETWGEAVKAYVVLKPGEKATPGELIEFCRGRLAGYKRPKQVQFLEDFPRTSFGKISKRALREFSKLSTKT